MSFLLDSLSQKEMENPFPPHATSLGGGFPSSSNFGMPNLTSTQEPEDPLHNTTLGNDDVENERVMVTMWLTQSSLTRNKNLGFTLGKADQFQSLPLYKILS